MAIDLSSIQTDHEDAPPIIVMYGVHGIGKTSFASCAPSPIFLRTEDGLGLLKVPAFPLAKTLKDVMEALEALAGDGHSFRTLCVDSLDWLEPLIWKQVCIDDGVNRIEEVGKGYGKGYVAALDYWREYIEAIKYLRKVKRMTIIQLAHTEIKRFDDPTTEGYDRYQIKLHKSASALVQEDADIVCFANYRHAVTKEEKGFNAKRSRAIGSGERVLCMEERPSFYAKNRFAMPDTFPLDWDAVAAKVPYYQQPQAAPAPQTPAPKPVPAATATDDIPF